MQYLEDFLSFRTFISFYVLFIFYYIGAIGAPIASWFLAIWLRKKYFLVDKSYIFGKKILITCTSKKQRVWFVSLLVLLFLWIEIIWRMLFEFLIAYLQIRDALLQI